MERVAVTGASGTIGTVLRAGLRGYEITPIDLPDHDVRDAKDLADVLRGHKTVIHLAWNTTTDNFKSNFADPDNLTMYQNVYQVATELGFKRVIMASSVHADDFNNWNEPELMKVESLPTPDSPYGASKVCMESMGRYFASKYNLEVVCIRFGGVSLENRPSPQESYVYLSHKDCVALLEAAVECKTIPQNFTIIYGVSSNQGKKHNNTNSIGWIPSNE
jgi:nucleoside-diphosphate-sugar epimerase